MNLTLNALPDDWTLHANGDVARLAMGFPFEYFLISPQGDFLTDPQGNFLIGYYTDVMYPQILNALPDDFRLNSE